ncbi:hypothetical protein GN956_G10298 [Arapaima gigas]
MSLQVKTGAGGSQVTGTGVRSRPGAGEARGSRSNDKRSRHPAQPLRSHNCTPQSELLLTSDLTYALKTKFKHLESWMWDLNLRPGDDWHSLPDQECEAHLLQTFPSGWPRGAVTEGHRATRGVSPSLLSDGTSLPLAGPRDV